MNNKNTIVIMTIVASVILVQLVSRGQPETGTAEETKTEIKYEVSSNNTRIGNLLANIPESWTGIRPSSSMRLMEFRLGLKYVSLRGEQEKQSQFQIDCLLVTY